MTVRTGQSDLESLAAAKLGDESAFHALTAPFSRELHIHCYRMLGSLDDADDALQETLLRAWRQIGGFEPRAPFRAWLYRIATNVCLTALTRRSRRERGRIERKDEQDVRLDPYPDPWLMDIGRFEQGPEATIERAESVHLAFVASVQFLPAKQRAALLLRDVLGYSAVESAEMLGITVAASNSALQRARGTIERERADGKITWDHGRVSDETETLLVRRLVDAWQAVDVAGIVEILREDALLTMPPMPLRFSGREAIGRFLATGPGGGRLDRFRWIPTRANRQPAVAGYYREGDAGDFRAHAVMVIAIEEGQIASLVRFADERLFARFGLPMVVRE
jgi:RNA polymerase sigma-70 factor (ECF subfamily)